MLELLLCSSITILPDWLYRRYVQGKRFGREITLYSVWYELRWGITSCLMLTVLLITMIFYFHPTAQSAGAYFRTVPFLPEVAGRVAEVNVGVSAEVSAGDPIFRLDASQQEAAVETARRRVAEIEAATAVALSDLDAAEGSIRSAEALYLESLNELENKRELQVRDVNVVAQREIDRLRTLADSREGAVAGAVASKEAVETRIAELLPAQKASAEALLTEAEVALSKTVFRAGTDGRVEQFTLRVGDSVNPFMRPAGVLVPDRQGRPTIVAGFGQIEAQVLRAGMSAEITCASKPLRVVPMVVVQVQEAIATGQVAIGDRLADPAQLAAEGTILAFMEPMFEGGLDDVPRGSACIANAYTSNHDLLASEDLGFGRRIFLHAVDAVGTVHAAILRIQALMLPIRTLVLNGH